MSLECIYIVAMRLLSKSAAVVCGRMDALRIWSSKVLSSISALPCCFGSCMNRHILPHTEGNIVARPLASRRADRALYSCFSRYRRGGVSER